MDEWIFFTAVVGIACIVGFGEILIGMAEDLADWLRSRRRRKPDLELERLARHQRTLKRIDELERELQVGKYDPDRIALGFDDTEPEPKPLDPEVDALPMPDAVEADEGCPCAACRSKRRAETSEELVDRLLAELNEAKPKPKPVDDSWADADIRDGAYGSETRGLLRRIVDSRGNWTEIRSFGS